MKLLKNKKNFLIFEMNVSELKDMNIGVNIPIRDLPFYNAEEVIEYQNGYSHKIFVCDFCNDAMTDKVYYVPVLSRAICKSCLEDFLNEEHYATDVDYEVEKYNMFVNELRRNNLINDNDNPDIKHIDYKLFIKDNINILNKQDFDAKSVGIEI